MKENKVILCASVERKLTVLSNSDHQCLESLWVCGLHKKQWYGSGDLRCTGSKLASVNPKPDYVFFSKQNGCKY